jgi:nucleotide-binding universal stress UspA family protein
MDGPGIVVAVDGSDTAQEALRWAVALAEALGAEVVAVHAVGLLEALHDPGMPEHAWRAGLRDVVETTWCAPLAKARCPHRVELRDGHPVDVVLGAADDELAVLLAMGSRGVGANPAMALGSTSLRVLQAARVPVLVVPDPREGASPAGRVALRHILVGLDRSEPSFAALELASDVADLLGGSISVLEVIDYVPPFPLGPSTAVTGKGEERALERVVAFLESEVRDIRTRGVGVQVIVRSGDPAPTLLEIAVSTPTSSSWGPGAGAGRPNCCWQRGPYRGRPGPAADAGGARHRATDSPTTQRRSIGASAIPHLSLSRATGHRP